MQPQAIASKNVESVFFYPHGIFAAGGALVLTQEKKNIEKILNYVNKFVHLSMLFHGITIEKNR